MCNSSEFLNGFRLLTRQYDPTQSCSIPTHGKTELLALRHQKIQPQEFEKEIISNARPMHTAWLPFNMLALRYYFIDFHSVKAFDRAWSLSDLSGIASTGGDESAGGTGNMSTKSFHDTYGVLKLQNIRCWAVVVKICKAGSGLESVWDGLIRYDQMGAKSMDLSEAS